MLSKPARFGPTLALFLVLALAPGLPGQGTAPAPADPSAAAGIQAPAAPKKSRPGRESLDNYAKGMFYHQEFTRYMVNQENLGLDEVKRLARENLLKSMDCLARVDPEKLRAIHPGLPVIFKTKLLVLVGMEKEIYLNTQTTRQRPDSREFLQKYATLLKSYMEWMQAHAPEFKQPAS
jgi:hypothetical protein